MRSDLHPFLGKEAGIGQGCTTGHEFVGRIVCKGTEVRGECATSAAAGRCRSWRLLDDTMH